MKNCPFLDITSVRNWTVTKCGPFHYQQVTNMAWVLRSDHHYLWCLLLLWIQSFFLKVFMKEGLLFMFFP